MNLKYYLSLFLSIFFTGCASIIAGTSQTLTLQTNPPGARCELTREGRIVGTVEHTPGAVTLDKTKHNIDVLCKKDGYIDAKEFAKSGTAGSTFGNIILGGGIGWAIDSAAGADNQYPDVITVNLSPALGQEILAENTKESSTRKLKVKAVSSKTETNLDGNAKKLLSLKQMHDQGLLTDEEYQSKRSSVVGNL